MIAGRDVEGIVAVVFHRSRDRDAAIGQGRSTHGRGRGLNWVEFEQTESLYRQKKRYCEILNRSD